VNEKIYTQVVFFTMTPQLFQRRIPPFDPSSVPAETDPCRRLDLTDPIPKMGCMVYDKRGTMFRENILKEPVKKYIPVYLLERFAIIPRRWTNETVIRSLISSVEKVSVEPIL